MTPELSLFDPARAPKGLDALFRPRSVAVVGTSARAKSVGREILSNLLENAARNSPPGASIGLRAGPDPDDAHRVRLEVLDRGPGVPAGVKRALAGRDPGDTGRTGLGLEICRSLSQALGGSVSLSDRTGGGTVARVALPAAGGDA